MYLVNNTKKKKHQNFKKEQNFLLIGVKDVDNAKPEGQPDSITSKFVKLGN